MNPLKWSEQTRAAIYRVLLAVLALAVVYGLVADAEQVSAWTALIAALFGNTLASINTTLQGGDSGDDAGEVRLIEVALLVAVVTLVILIAVTLL